MSDQKKLARIALNARIEAAAVLARQKNLADTAVAVAEGAVR